ncbi:MAG: site-2 protease family protein [Cyclobacteriaceae bacterium]|jgi:membrane-associated protease RseP (regulator of RpoE activity)|nr:site-2 protease family protein [Cyclobacteriaceae bacterium]
MSKETRRLLLQVLLFVLTLITTTIAGAEWSYGKSIYAPGYTWADFFSGLHFSVPFLLILTVHELGHYLTARHYGVNSSLPYYIPMPPFPLSIGTMGAIIRLRERVRSMKINFDIGIAGPLAGFIMALIVLFYGFLTLPPPEHIFEIHPEYEAYGLDYAEHVYAEREDIVDVWIGKNLLFLFFEYMVADPSRMPNPHEIMHYPYLFSGFLALIFTSLNLLPIGQLDGGHVLYGLVGFHRHRMIASIIFLAFVFYAGLGLVHPAMPIDDLVIYIPAYIIFLTFCFKGLKLPMRDTIMYAMLVFAMQFVVTWLRPGVTGYTGWLLFALIIGRLAGVLHPPSEIEEPLDSNRQVLGWIALIIFVLCFSPNPIEIR